MHASRIKGNLTLPFLTGCFPGISSSTGVSGLSPDGTCISAYLADGFPPRSCNDDEGRIKWDPLRCGTQFINSHTRVARYNMADLSYRQTGTDAPCVYLDGLIVTDHKHTCSFPHLGVSLRDCWAARMRFQRSSPLSRLAHCQAARTRNMMQSTDRLIDKSIMLINVDNKTSNITDLPETLCG